MKRVEVNLSLADSISIATVAKVMALELRIDFGRGGTTSLEIHENEVEHWWNARDEFREELKHTGMPVLRSRDVVLDIWKGIEKIRWEINSPRNLALGGA